MPKAYHTQKVLKNIQHAFAIIHSMKSSLKNHESKQQELLALDKSFTALGNLSVTEQKQSKVHPTHVAEITNNFTQNRVKPIYMVQRNQIKEEVTYFLDEFKDHLTRKTSYTASLIKHHVANQRNIFEQRLTG